MTDRVADALQYLAAEFSVSRAEFRTDQQPDGDDLLDGLLSKGYVIHKGDRYAVSTTGRRYLADWAPIEEVE